MRLGTASRLGFGVFAAVILAFIYVPIGVVTINSFNSDRTFGWPPPGLTTQWWSIALQAPGPREALLTSVKAGLGATAIALVLGSLLALALTRYSFFGKHAISLLVVLPIALPGHRHGRRPPVGDRQRAPTRVRHQRRTLHDHRRPRHLLHRRGVQQRDGPAAPAGRVAGGGLGRPRGAAAHDVPAGHVPPPALGGPGWRPVGLRAELRRDRRHHLHGGPGDARPCRSGSSTTSSDPTRLRWSTWWPCCWS